MTAESPAEHWDRVYASRGETEVSWFQDDPAPSLDLIARLALPSDAAIVDVGGGASRLVDALLDRGFTDLTVLDLSQAALAASRARLGARADRVTWVVADATAWRPPRRYDLWHDRAAFHFLTEPASRAAYVARMTEAVKPGGHVVLATFALDGPERCSGLPVVRYDGESLARTLGPAFAPIDTLAQVHRTPSGGEQRFQFTLLRRVTSSVAE